MFQVQGFWTFEKPGWCGVGTYDQAAFPCTAIATSPAACWTSAPVGNGADPIRDRPSSSVPCSRGSEQARWLHAAAAPQSAATTWVKESGSSTWQLR